jgi:hypothetical protein
LGENLNACHGGRLPGGSRRAKPKNRAATLDGVSIGPAGNSPDDIPRSEIQSMAWPSRYEWLLILLWPLVALAVL